MNSKTWELGPPKHGQIHIFPCHSRKSSPSEIHGRRKSHHPKPIYLERIDGDSRHSHSSWFIIPLTFRRQSPPFLEWRWPSRCEINKILHFWPTPWLQLARSDPYVDKAVVLLDGPGCGPNAFKGDPRMVLK